MTTPNPEHDRYIAIWSKAVDTQMHFNEMSVKSRQLGLAFVAAALGVGVVLLSRGDDFSIPVDIRLFRFQLHVSVLLILGALLAIWAVMVLDLRVYHRMLRGAVTFGEDFEQNYMKQIFNLEKGMTQVISHYSRHDDAGKKSGPDGRYEYTGSSEITAEKKIRGFYNRVMWFLAIAALLLFIFTNLIATDARPNRDASNQRPTQSIEDAARAVTSPTDIESDELPVANPANPSTPTTEGDQ